MIRNFSGFAPTVAVSAYIDPSAQVIGDVVQLAFRTKA
jgi:carbonic anhydrase/acetyltransferase-like protein (isoleucine patch superfamily)